MVSKFWIIPIIAFGFFLYWATESYELGTFHYRPVMVESVSMNPERDFYTVSGYGNNVQIDKLWVWQYGIDLHRVALAVNETIGTGKPVLFGCYGFVHDDNQNLYNYSDCASFCVIEQTEPELICSGKTFSYL